MNGMVRIWAFALALVATGGCTYYEYFGVPPTAPRGEVAAITCSHLLNVSALDGKPVPPARQPVNGLLVHRYLAVPPGEHSFGVEGESAFSVKLDAVIAFVVEAGHQYLIDLDRLWTEGNVSRIRAYVLDRTTGRRIQHTAP